MLHRSSQFSRSWVNADVKLAVQRWARAYSTWPLATSDRAHALLKMARSNSGRTSRPCESGQRRAWKSVPPCSVHASDYAELCDEGNRGSLLKCPRPRHSCCCNGGALCAPSASITPCLSWVACRGARALIPHVAPVPAKSFVAAREQIDRLCKIHSNFALQFEHVRTSSLHISLRAIVHML